MNSIAVSVVVPTFNRPDFLDRCLSALVSQDFDHTRYEVVIVDDAANPKTRQQVETWAQRTEMYILWPNLKHKTAIQTGEFQTEETFEEQAAAIRFAHAPEIRYIPVQGEHGPAAARNTGWKAAQGDIIAFTDDDCVPAEGWLKAGMKVMESGVHGASGKIMMPISFIPTDYEVDASGLERSEFVTANSFYRRDALEAVGGFDTRFTVAWREDTDIYFTMLEKGYHLAKAPDAIVVHPIRPAPWGISLRQQRKSQFNALLYKKHPDLYRRRIQPGPPWRYYFLIIMFLGVLTGLALRIEVLAGMCVGLWLGFTLSFFLQRLHGTSHSIPHIIEMAITSLLIPPLSVYWRLRGAARYRVRFM